MLLVKFSKGNNGYIGKIFSDNGAFIVPSKNIEHNDTPKEGLFWVNIIGKRSDGRLRYAQIIISVQKEVQEILSSPQLDGVTISHILRPIGSAEIRIAKEKEHKYYTLNVTKEGCVREIAVRYLPHGNSELSSTYNFSISGTEAWNNITEEKEEKEKEEKEKEEAKKNQEQRVRNDPMLLEAILPYLEAALTQKERPRVQKKILGELGALPENIIEDIVTTLSRGRVGAYRSDRDENIVFYPLLREEYKAIFLQEHPECEIPIMDPDFWEKAAKEKGEYQGQYKSRSGYGDYLKNKYLLQVMDGWFTITVDAGFEGNEKLPFQ